jgi:hypothetical protein
MDGFEWGSVQMLNKARVEEGLPKLTVTTCLARAAGSAILQSFTAETPTPMTPTMLNAVKTRCGLSRISQIVDDAAKGPTAEVAHWKAVIKDRVKWLQPDLTVIGVARLEKPGTNTAYWFVYLGAS